ncbi:MAG: choice-of-anchor J domain-containing protein, partial [Bacteroidia bacterium]|nr:choice-of-anchor J domain-containing protein [Bacteroidia bacterium]
MKTTTRIATSLLITATMALALLGTSTAQQRSSKPITPSFTVQNASKIQTRVQAAPETKPLISNLSHARTTAPGDTLLFVDFQMGIPGNFRNIDDDGLDDANNRPQEFFPFVDLQTTTPGDTNIVAAASSWFNPPGISDNKLITPGINITGTDYVLQWKSAPFEGPAYTDGYKVVISTDSLFADPSQLDTVAIFAEADGNGVFGDGIQHPTFNGTRGVLKKWQVSLSGYVGQRIFIAYWHQSDDDNLIMLDDIFVGRIPSVEIG